MKRILLTTTALLFAAASAWAEGTAVKIQCDRTSVGMGQTVVVKAEASREDGKPAAGWELLPYVNGRRWGGHEKADTEGKAVFYLPLPQVGGADIRVAAVPSPSPEAKDTWIWYGPSDAPGRAWLQKSFTITGEPEDAMLWLAVADIATINLNGKQVAHKSGWTSNAPILLPAATLRSGVNVLSVAVLDNKAPGGLLLRLRTRTSQEIQNVLTDKSWVGFAKEPAGWPGAATGGGAVTLISRGDADKALTDRYPWPTALDAQRITGTPLDPAFSVSTPIRVTVEKRALKRPPVDPDHLVAMQWEGWMVPLAVYWDTAQAVPLMGFYDSVLSAVARQHLIWMTESGMDCVIGDVSNNLWYVDTFDTTRPDMLELFRSCHTMMDEMAKLRDEGQPFPRMTLLTGVSHVRPNGIRAVNAQLDYIWNEFVANPKYKGLWQQFDGKPLVLSLDLAQSYLKEGFKMDDRFAVRFTGATQDVYKQNEQGFWTWMDYKFPAVAYKDGKAESMTASVGTFGDGGWLGTGDQAARGRRNGATLIEDWKEVMKHRPRFTIVHQFQEFAGALEGHPVRPPNFYGDSYSVELSDDSEPTSPTMHAYRGEGGWGFYYVNLIRALVDLYRQNPATETTAAVISKPFRGEVLTSPSVEVQWMAIGKEPTSYTLWANGKEMARDLKGNGTRLDLADLPDGLVTLRLQAADTVERYPLSWTQEAVPSAKPGPAGMEVEFTLRRAKTP